MMQALHMHADLMRTPGQDMHVQKRRVFQLDGAVVDLPAQVVELSLIHI